MDALGLVEVPAAVAMLGGFNQLGADSVWRIAMIWEEVLAATRAGESHRQRLHRKLRHARLLPPNPVAPWLIDAVAWSSAPPSCSSTAAVVRWTDACTALVDAYRAGLGFFWVLDDWIVAVPRPAISVVEGVLHSATGPAVRWPEGERYWYWHGLRVPRRVVEEPESITAWDIHAERNMELRSVLLERMGFDRYIYEGGGRLIAEDGFGRLWRCRRLPDEDETPVFVEVENATVESDGSARRYFLRVPPAMRTPHQAVAWSFGLSVAEYAPLAES